MDAVEPAYDFAPRINPYGDKDKFILVCYSQKVPSDGENCGENEYLENKNLFNSEPTCSRPGLYSPVADAEQFRCKCKENFVRDDITGECIHRSKCPNYKSPKEETAKVLPTSKTSKPHRGSRITGLKEPLVTEIPNMTYGNFKTLLFKQTTKNFDTAKKSTKAEASKFHSKEGTKKPLRLCPLWLCKPWKPEDDRDFD
jgi:hypothetical protein